VSLASGKVCLATGQVSLASSEVFLKNVQSSVGTGQFDIGKGAEAGQSSDGTSQTIVRTVPSGNETCRSSYGQVSLASWKG
jgi:hypothetical protein